MTAAQRGLFIAFEGGEGAGKSTQVQRLADVLRVRYGREVVVTREPGGSWLGCRLRELVLGKEVPAVEDGKLVARRVGSGINPRAELLMYLADRAQHVGEVIVPALNAGRVVISDRHAGSSIAYQGAGRGFGELMVRQLSAFATGSLQPDLTVLLDVAPEVGLARAARRGDGNRFEAEELAFHDRVRASFLRQAKSGGKSWVVHTVGAFSAEQVAERVEWSVAERLGLEETGRVDVAARR